MGAQLTEEIRGEFGSVQEWITRSSKGKNELVDVQQFKAMCAQTTELEDDKYQLVFTLIDHYSRGSIRVEDIHFAIHGLALELGQEAQIRLANLIAKRRAVTP